MLHLIRFILFFVLVSICNFSYGQTSVVAVFDETDNYEFLSQNFLTMISNKNDTKSAIFTKKEYDSNKITSQQYCIFIGADCSSHLTFDDVYSNFGIQIGYNGKSAWIKCDDANMDKEKNYEFSKLLEEYCKRFKLEKLYKEDYLSYEKSNIGTSVGEFLGSYGGGIMGYYLGGYLGSIYDEASKKSFVLKYKYLLGELIFYDKYLDNYLKEKPYNKH